MRVQSSFEKIAQNANAPLFSFCFVGLRILLGCSAFYAAINLPVWAPAEQPAWLGIVLPALLAVCGTSFVLGVLVRPLAVTAMIVTVVLALGVLQVTENMAALLPLLGLLFLLGLYTSGGAGHAAGLDGILLRNIRRPGALAKFLFG